MFRLEPLDVANGVLLETTTSARLSVEQMVDIAQYALWSRWYAVSVEWAEAAQELNMTPELSVLLDEGRQYHDSVWEAPDGMKGILPNEMMFVSKIYDEDGLFKTAKHLRNEEQGFFKSEKFNEELTGPVLHNFYKVCRGEKSTNSPYERYGCILSDADDPYFVLAPLRKELLSMNPPIFIVHGIISKAEMEYMIDQDTLNPMVITF